MSRKNVSVEAIKANVNRMIAESTCNAEGRMGMLKILESILHETGNYKGFCYLTVNEVPHGHLPGINLDQYGEHMEDYEKRFLNTDKTRVFYF